MPKKGKIHVYFTYTGYSYVQLVLILNMVYVCVCVLLGKFYISKLPKSLSSKDKKYRSRFYYVTSHLQSHILCLK